MAQDESSELSSVLSELSSADESEMHLDSREGILKFFHKKVKRNPELQARDPSPPRPRREPSPPHEYMLADNPDIAYVVMFRARFKDAFAKGLPNFGPQELEHEIDEDTVPGDRVELFLCALLGLLLNRKQDVKPGHYHRALEEAIQTHKNQWPRAWERRSVLANGTTFGSMDKAQRLALLRTLIQWSLSSSDAIKSTINAQYKSRAEDDLNVSLSVQPWGSDGDKRRYFLIEGNDDTSFRVYRESNPAGLHRTWWNVAGTTDELKALAEKLENTDGGPKARALAKRILASIPRFETTEEKRRRREYRQMQKERFKRPADGSSLYEGRTRGKRVKYNYEDEDLFDSDDTGGRPSARNTRNHTPAEPSGPIVTASGRQVRAPTRLAAKEATTAATSAAPSVAADIANDTDVATQDVGIKWRGRPRHSAAVYDGMNGWAHDQDEWKSGECRSDQDEDEESGPDDGDNEKEHLLEEGDEDEEDLDDAEPEDEEESDDTGGLQDRNNRVFQFVFKFPISVAFDGKGKVKKVEASESMMKHTRPLHRNIVESSESTPGPSGPEAAIKNPTEPSGPTSASALVTPAETSPVVPATTEAMPKELPPGPTFHSPLTPPEPTAAVPLVPRENLEKPAAAALVSSADKGAE